MEPIFRKNYTVTEAHLDSSGKVKLSALLGFALNAAGGHCVELNADWDTLAKQDLFWAVLRHRLQLSRYPQVGETITLETWPMPTTRSAYPRAAVAYDAEGREVFRLVSLWVLMDMKARTMVLPGKSGVTVDGILRGGEPDVPSSIAPVPLENTTRRQVSTEDLDKNNHMTNTRYLDWIDDLLAPEFRAEKIAKELVICYLSEALLGQQIQLQWQVTAEGCLQVEGRREHTDVPTKPTRIFAAKVYF